MKICLLGFDFFEVLLIIAHELNYHEYDNGFARAV